MLSEIKKELRKCQDKKQAINLSRFFKTGKGEYGEGDKFLGLKMPYIRAVAKKYNNSPVSVLNKLILSVYHEDRMCALLIAVIKYEKGNNAEKQQIYDWYLAHTKFINNWDLVDVTTPRIVGIHLLNGNRAILYKLANSKLLWDRRIAVLATSIFIRENDFKDILKLSHVLLIDKHDLIHKAVGWMLREVGKKDKTTLLTFLNKHYKKMPRTMLRYAIEKFDENERRDYLLGEINA